MTHNAHSVSGGFQVVLINWLHQLVEAGATPTHVCPSHKVSNNLINTDAI